MVKLFNKNQGSWVDELCQNNIELSRTIVSPTMPNWKFEVLLYACSRKLPKSYGI